MAKETLEKAYALVEKLTTKEQVELKQFIQKVLETKEQDAENELELIKGGK